MKNTKLQGRNALYVQNIIAVFARAPERGKVKTRLAKSVGDEAARDVYVAMLHDVLAGVQRVASQMANTQVVVFYTPRDAFSRAVGSLRESWNGAHFPQSDGDLGDKLFKCFDVLHEGGAKNVVVIGTDAPDLPLSILVQAFETLEKNELVFGPSEDGGFYLMGASCDVPWCFFKDVCWSSSSTLNDVMTNLWDERVNLLPRWSDVDTLDDLRALRKRLQSGQSAAPHTFLVLEALDF